MTETGEDVAQANEDSTSHGDISRIFGPGHEGVDKDGPSPGQSSTCSAHKGDHGLVGDFAGSQEGVDLTAAIGQVVFEEDTICLIQANGDKDVEKGTQQHGDLSTPSYWSHCRLGIGRSDDTLQTGLIVASYQLDRVPRFCECG